MFTKILSYLLIFSLSTPLTFAQETGFSLSDDIKSAERGSEFISGDYPGAVLMKVNIWGAVFKSGIHHIPVNTDLTTLLSYAGGPRDNAELENIFIRRRVKGKELLIDVNAENYLRDVNAPKYQLEANDIIVVPASDPLINPNVASTIGFVASLLGLILASLALSDRFGSSSQ